MCGITPIRYAQYRNIGKPNNLKVFGSNKTKGPKQDSKTMVVKHKYHSPLSKLPHYSQTEFTANDNGDVHQDNIMIQKLIAFATEINHIFILLYMLNRIIHILNRHWTYLHYNWTSKVTTEHVFHIPVSEQYTSTYNLL